MPLFQVTFDFSAEQVDVLEALLLEWDDGRWNLYLDHETEEGRASGVYESEKEAREDWQRIEPHLKESLGILKPRYETLPDADWKDSYKDHFQPWSCGGLHWVPDWLRDEYPFPEGDAVLWLDPGMAFGTGNHETTRLCIEALIDFIDVWKTRGDSLNDLSCCDAGCGSGILALSARKLGIPAVVGFDNDPDAVRISHENTELNELEGEVEFFVGDLETGFRKIKYHVVFANILASVLIEHPHTILNSLRAGGRLILSGILTCEIGNVHQTYLETLSRMGKTGTFTQRELGEWSSLIIDLDSEPR